MNPILARQLGLPEGYNSGDWDGPELFTQTPYDGMQPVGAYSGEYDFYGMGGGPLYYQGDGGLWSLYGSQGADKPPPPPNLTLPGSGNMGGNPATGPKADDIYGGMPGGAQPNPAPMPMPTPIISGGSGAPPGGGGSMGPSPYGSLWGAYNAGVARQGGPNPYGGLPSLVAGAGEAG